MNKSAQEPKLENYDICLFRIPKTGGRVIWEITNSCNYSCGYCIFTAENGKIPGELTTNDVFDVLDGLKSKKFSHIKFTGGEPFIRDDLMRIFEKTADLGFIVDVSTNASLITAEKARRIKEYGLQMVHVSVDGHNRETHEAARGKNTYERTIKGIQHLTDNGIYVRVGTVIFKANENYLENLVQSAASLGVDEVIFSFMEPVGRMRGDSSVISTRPIHEVKEELEMLSYRYSADVKVGYSFTEKPTHDKQGICPAVNKFLYIDNLGRVSPCTWVVENNPGYRTQRTLKEVSLNELLGSAQIQQYLTFLNQEKSDRWCPVRLR